MSYKKKIAQAINRELGINLENIEEFIEIPPRVEMGDFAFPCFKLAKIIRKSPNIIAKELKEKLYIEDFEKIEISNSYVNFFVDKGIFIKEVLEKIIIEGNGYGDSDIGEGKCICIEYFSTDITKPLNVEQLFTLIIGHSLCNLFEKSGYMVKKLSYSKDWGIHFGKLIYAYKRWGTKDALKKNGTAELSRLYNIFHDECNKNVFLREESIGCFKRLEKCEKDFVILWNEIKSASLKEYKEVYSILNIKFDSEEEESLYNNKMKILLEKLIHRGLINESDGVKLIRLDKFNLPPYIILKDDRFDTYQKVNLAVTIDRKNKYDFYKCIYVVGNKMKTQFKQIFKILDIAGYEWIEDCIYAGVGLVKFNDIGREVRSGEEIILNNIIREAIDKILNIINVKKLNLENSYEFAKNIGIGGIRFTCLRNSREKNILFDWEEMFSFKEGSYLYVQYSYARAINILAKNKEVNIKDNLSKLDSKEEFELVKFLEKFNVVINDAIENLEPSILLLYIIEVTKKLNKLYDIYSIVNINDNELIGARLAIIKATCQVINNALNLIDIEAIEEYDILYKLII